MLWKWLEFYGFKDVVFCGTEEAEDILMMSDFDLVVIDWEDEDEEMVFSSLEFVSDGGGFCC